MVRESRLRHLLEVAERHTRGGRNARAVAFYRKVLAHTQDGDFERELAHVRLGDLHLTRGETESAVLHLQRALRLSGGEPEYALMLGQALMRLDRLDEAFGYLHDALQSDVRAAEALAALARGLHAAGDRPAAATLARLAVERCPDDAEYRALSRELADA